MVAATVEYAAPASRDFWAARLDMDGAVEWQFSYGADGQDDASSAQETMDGGFIIAGTIFSSGAGESDIWVIELDGAGTPVWQKTYGGADLDYAHSIQPLRDGGFIVAGETKSFGEGGRDIIVLRLDGGGNVIWQKTYGGPEDDHASEILGSMHGGYILVGKTSSFGAGEADIWILKLDENGNISDTCPTGIGADVTVEVHETHVLPEATSISPYAADYRTYDADFTEGVVHADTETQCSR
jgi:hypothetical protein